MAMSRSENMRRIKGKNTRPERLVRTLLRQLGYMGYRLHRKDIPGKPDIAFLGRRKVIFVHGCFWHGHTCKVGQREPKSNTDYWCTKIERNRLRDASHLADLGQHGWRVLVIWECELADIENVAKKVVSFMADSPPDTGARNTQ
ncbi:very short patch repair endonuclease [Paraburkholderia silvatlantica]|uniref:very short patch repair endonuclease n=1 Tax=Paraburkholderia silvatlantica TaxID=321895 RepID=UPI003753B0B5